jgi:hypothetical protein
MAQQVIKSKDSKSGTIIFDLGVYRAIVYKVGKSYVLRVGERRSGLIAPADEFFARFSTRRVAESSAISILEDLHSGSGDIFFWKS